MVMDLLTFRRIGINMKVSTHKTIWEVSWIPPEVGYIKANCVGYSRGNLGSTGAGVICGATYLVFRLSPQRSPLLSPVSVKLPDSISAVGDTWKNVSGGGCGFAMAISGIEMGKLITWGSTDDMGLSYVTSGKHEDMPQPFPLPNNASIVKAAAGWAHCIVVTVWEKLDQEITATPMPEIYQNKMVWILCNDCGKTSEVHFHIVAHKCLSCNSYNMVFKKMLVSSRSVWEESLVKSK